MKDLAEKFGYPTRLSEVIKDFVTEKYEVPLTDIPYWIENGWKHDEVQNKMHRKGRESVNVQQSKVNKL